MRVCYCILGHNGKCCQEQGSGQQVGMTTGRLVAGHSYTYGQRTRVRKLVSGVGWLVTNHPAGAQTFATWREAMHYASTALFTWNGALS